MARFLGYHAGLHGTGWRRRALSVPLATGGAVHVGVELLCGWIHEYQAAHQGMPPDRMTKHLDVIAWAASEAAIRYEAGARARGFLERGLEGVGEGEDDAGHDMRQSDHQAGGNPIPDQLSAHRGSADIHVLPAAVEHLILEQRTLIEAQVWVFAALILPQILGESRILDVEHEESLVLDCTCGLGDGVADWVVHDQRGCSGIVQMGRADILCEGWADQVRGQITYLEVKTKATPNLPWEKAWEHSGQLRINMETASRRLGKPIEAAYIPVLFKGWRGRDKGDPPEAPKYQHSPLVYGYYDPGSPGFRAAEWKSSYKWVDDYGKGHTLPRTYDRQPIWEETRVMPYATARAEAGRVERWVLDYLQPAQWPALAKLLGPFPHQRAWIPETLQSVLAEERDWRDLVGYIRDEVQQGHGTEAQIASSVITRSWNCLSFSGEPCAFQPLCFKQPGWEDPGTMNLFDIRTPHHSTERLAYEAVGLVFPANEAEEDDTE
jgi:hypothetical protein